MAVANDEYSNHEDATEATMFFLSRSERYMVEKPYTTRYDPEGSFPSTNVEAVAHKLKVRSLRQFMGCLPYDKTGFQVVQLESQMSYEDYTDNAKIEKIHLPEVEVRVKNLLGACKVLAFDFEVRRQHPEFPIATGRKYDHPQPTSRVHLDYTRKYVCDEILPEHSSTPFPRWQCVNVWHPLKGPVENWPLALCDASTIDFGADTMPGDIVERRKVLENTQVHYNHNHRWYWLPGQLPSELLIFKNADSQSADGSTSHGVAHAAFDIPCSASVASMRESIEIRLLVLWDNEVKEGMNG